MYLFFHKDIFGRSAILFALFLFLSACSSTKYNKKTKPVSFSTEELKLIESAERGVPMDVLLITDPRDSLILRTKSKDVNPQTGEDQILYFTDRLLTIVRDSMHLGVGIAAPQVGILRSIIIVQRFDKEGFPFEFFLNPKILQYSNKKQPCPEGCLSIPDKQAVTQNRAYAILLQHQKMDGTLITEMVEDFTAVIFQHEIDHLNCISYN